MTIAAEGSRAEKPHKAAGGPWWLSFLERHAVATVLLLMAGATVRVVLTYPVYSHTFDEPAHIAAGMEWLDKKTYRLDPQHPPLARVMTALGPYLAGGRSHGYDEINREGLAILDATGHYDGVLALARMGILPFLWTGCVVVYAWSRRYFGATVAVMAVFLFTQLPAILAHSGLATTDMAVAALVGATVYTTLCWLETPTVRRTVMAGGCLGLAVLSKFSALIFVPAALLAMFAWYLISARPSFNTLLSLARSRLSSLLLGIAAAVLVIWAGYQFTFGRVSVVGLQLPAPALYSGVSAVIAHNRQGHDAYLLGQRRRFGWWYFFPVALSVKTPLPFLFLALAGAVVTVRSKTPARWPLACSIGILLSVMPSHINLGTRHVVVIYVGLTIVAAAFAVDRLRQWRRNPWVGGAVIGVLVWLTVSVGLSHPDYLPYFNGIAGREPERILVDSDLDWGQDLKRLAKRLREVGARDVAVLPSALAERDVWVRYLARLGFPPVRDIDYETAPSPGWNAVSLTVLKVRPARVPHELPPHELWPDTIKPQERVGKGILLYYVPAGQGR